MGRLTPSQQGRARRLQEQGQTLREIARAIGADYEAVCLLLYGGVADWTPPAAKALPAPWTKPEGPKPPPMYYPPGKSPEITPAAKANEGKAEISPRQDAASDGFASRPDAGRSASAGGGAGMASSPALRKGTRVRLRNDLGEFLHQSGAGMTRKEEFAWVGNAAQLEAIRKRFVHLRDLDEDWLP